MLSPLQRVFALVILHSLIAYCLASNPRPANIAWVNKVSTYDEFYKFLQGPDRMVLETITLDVREERLLMGSNRNGKFPFSEFIRLMKNFNRGKTKQEEKGLKVEIRSLDVYDKMIYELVAYGSLNWLTVHFDYFQGPGGGQPVLDPREFKSNVIEKLPKLATVSFGMATRKTVHYGYTTAMLMALKSDWDKYHFNKLQLPHLYHDVDFVFFVLHLSKTDSFVLTQIQDSLKKVHMVEMRLAEEEIKQVDMKVFQKFLNRLGISKVYLNVPESFRQVLFKDDDDEDDDPNNGQVWSFSRSINTLIFVMIIHVILYSQQYN